MNIYTIPLYILNFLYLCQLRKNFQGDPMKWLKVPQSKIQTEEETRPELQELLCRSLGTEIIFTGQFLLAFSAAHLTCIIC